MLDFRIETFLVLCKTMSYTQTAQLLNITQPTVTGHIKHLESVYGCDLFRYSGRMLSLTPKGEELLHYAQAMNANSLSIFEKMKKADAHSPSFRIGATKTIGEFYIHNYIKQYLNLFPKAQLNIIVDNTHTLLEYLDNGELDFVLIEGLFDKAKYEFRTIKRERFLGVCSPASPLANRIVCMTDLLQERLFVREEGSGTREILEQVLHERSMSVEHFKSRVTLNNFGGIKELVKANTGITFVYYPVVEQELKEGTISQIEIRNFEIKREFNFVCLQNSLFLKEYEGFVNPSLLFNRKDNHGVHQGKDDSIGVQK